MRKNAIFITIFAVIAGIVGFFLRTNELLSIFDEKGLSVRGAPETLILILLSAIILVVSIAWTLLLPREKMQGTKERYAFAHPGIGSFCITIICGLLVIVSAAAYGFRQDVVSFINGIDIAFIVFAVLTGIAFILMGLNAFKYTSSTVTAVFSVIPALFLCYWLVISYKINARNPDLIAYIYEYLALGIMALSFYFRAGTYFSRMRPKMTIFIHVIGIYFGILALADYREFAEDLIVVACVLLQLLQLYCFVRNQKPIENTTNVTIEENA